MTAAGAAVNAKPSFAPINFAPAAVDVERRADGSLVLRSPQALKPYARCVGEWLVRWAREAPERVFLAERCATGWQKVCYGEALEAACAIGSALLRRGLSAQRPVAILSDNGIDHALLMLGAMHVGVPVAPVSPAYSLMSRDHAKLKGIFQLLRPGLVYAADGSRFAVHEPATGAVLAMVADATVADGRAALAAAHAAQPAASAGPILRVAVAAGKFHGVTSSATPIGWCSVRMRLAPPGAMARRPSRRTASSENQRRNSAA